MRTTYELVMNVSTSLNKFSRYESGSAGNEYVTNSLHFSNEFASRVRASASLFG